MTAEELSVKCDEFDKLINSTIATTQEETYPIVDGIIDPERFISAKHKILWILKQPYDEFNEDGTPFGGGWNIRGLIKSFNFFHEFKGGRKTFKPMIYTSWGILNNFCMWEDMDDVEKEPSMLNALKSTAYINVQKLPGFKTTHYSVCNEAYHNYELLLKQIELINPDIIIGGGTLHYFIEDLKLFEVPGITEGSIHLYYTNDRLYI